ncbi:hypothetical protein [Mycobacterium avium]|uniref:hypothetical protein n=1 Tax=Mycobacterium avium TaxID=1764 RepID=UPI000A0182CF|nr:hypothetical protein [Mycobacterium avium]
MGTNLNDHQLDAALTALAIVDAAIDRDNKRVDVLLEPWTDVAPIMQYMLWLVERLITVIGQGRDPHEGVDRLRREVLKAIAEKDTTEDS